MGSYYCSGASGFQADVMSLVKHLKRETLTGAGIAHATEIRPRVVIREARRGKCMFVVEISKLYERRTGPAVGELTTSHSGIYRQSLIFIITIAQLVEGRQEEFNPQQSQP